MKLLRFSIFLLCVAILGWGIYNLSEERKALDSEVDSLRERSEEIREENKFVSERIDFFKNPDNLVNEIKSQMNVVKPGESLIIVVPPNEISGESGATSTE